METFNEQHEVEIDGDHSISDIDGLLLGMNSHPSSLGYGGERVIEFEITDDFDIIAK